MTYQHRPLSSILAPTHEPKAEGQKRDPETGQFVSPAPAEEKTTFTLPEKYAGKSAEDIAKMHMNAEKELGRVRNEVGTYRGLVSDLSSLQRTPEAPQTVEQEKIDVSGDELLTDPGQAIDKVVTKRLDERDARYALDKAETQLSIEEAAVARDFPDLEKTVLSEEFKAFAGRTPSRQADWQTAATGEGMAQVQAARRLHRW